MSFKVEVQDKSDNDKWIGNGLRFATSKEADAWANATLFGSWFGETRIVYSEDPINYPPPDKEDEEGVD